MPTPVPPPEGKGQSAKATFLVKKYPIFSSIAEFILKTYRLLFLNANAVESAKAMRFVIQLFYQIDVFRNLSFVIRHLSFVTTNQGFVLQSRWIY